MPITPSRGNSRLPAPFAPLTSARRLATLAASALSRLCHGLPSQCAICHAWPSERICAACLARFAVARHRCRTCAMPVPEAITQCGECLRHPPALGACVTAVDYAYPWAPLIAAFKFGHDPSWAAPFAHMLQRAPHAQALIAQADIVLPVPLARERLAERGFNQSLLLARRLALPGTLHAHLLVRTQHAVSQARLTRAQRLRNLRHAFAVLPEKQHLLRERRVLLIDDVMTTGATLHRAAEAIRAAGASEVAALVFARTS